MTEIAKAVFITGACKNTGYAIARRFAGEGYAVGISSRDAGQVREAVGSLAGEFPLVPIRGYVMDPADPADIVRAFGEIRRDFGRLDAFVSNAAHLGVDMGLLGTTPQDYDAVMDANARGCFFGCQQAAELMIESGGGAIVTIGSVHYKGAIPGRMVYAASKGALMTMTRCMAYELGKYNIRANCLVAGAIWSERWNGLTDEEKEQRRSRYPVGRESTPEEIADSVFFLCSDGSRTVTGIDFTIDSGVSACLLPYDKEWNAK